MANSVYQYEQPRCPDGWNEAERRFYNRLIQVLDDIYAKYGRIDAKLLDKSVINKIETAPETALEKAVADVISAGNIAADKFQGTFAYLVSLSAKYGDFDFETVKNLVADALVLEKGQANEVHITNLSATYAQAVRATIGSLCIKSKDGGYFQLDVDSDGRVSAVPVDVSEGEIAAGETDSGKVIVGTNVTAEMLNTASLAATQALINTIDAARINVEELVARDGFIGALTSEQAFVAALFADEAFLELLRTSKIVSDTTLEVVIGSQADMNRWFTFDDKLGLTIRKPEWTDEDGTLHPASIWSTVTDETGYHIRRSDLLNPVGSFERDRLTTPAVQVGKIVVKPTSRGGWVWKPERE